MRENPNERDEDKRTGNSRLPCRPQTNTNKWLQGGKTHIECPWKLQRQIQVNGQKRHRRKGKERNIIGEKDKKREVETTKWNRFPRRAQIRGYSQETNTQNAHGSKYRWVTEAKKKRKGTLREEITMKETRTRERGTPDCPEGHKQIQTSGCREEKHTQNARGNTHLD